MIEAESNEKLKEMEEEKLIAEQRLAEADAKTRQEHTLTSFILFGVNPSNQQVDQKIPLFLTGLIWF